MFLIHVLICIVLFTEYIFLFFFIKDDNLLFLYSRIKWTLEDWKFSQKVGFQPPLTPKQWCTIVMVMETPAHFSVKAWIFVFFFLFGWINWRQLAHVSSCSDQFVIMELSYWCGNGILNRNCKKIGIIWIWSFCNGLPRIRSFRRSPLLYSQLWHACWWCNWAILQNQR